MRTVDKLNTFINEASQMREQLSKLDNHIVPDFRRQSQNVRSDNQYQPEEDLKQLVEALKYSVQTMEATLEESN